MINPLIFPKEMSYDEFSNRLDGLINRLPIVGQLRCPVSYEYSDSQGRGTQLLEDYLRQSIDARKSCNNFVWDNFSWKSFRKQTDFSILARYDQYVRPSSDAEKNIDKLFYKLEVSEEYGKKSFLKSTIEDDYFGPDRLLKSVFTLLIMEQDKDTNLSQEYRFLDNYVERQKKSNNPSLESITLGYGLYIIEGGHVDLLAINNMKESSSKFETIGPGDLDYDDMCRMKTRVSVMRNSPRQN